MKKMINFEENYLTPIWINDESHADNGRCFVAIGNLRVSRDTFATLEDASNWVFEHPVIITSGVCELLANIGSGSDSNLPPVGESSFPTE